MDEVKHTQGTWEAAGNCVRTQFTHGDTTQRGWLIAECSLGALDGEANARRIVQCVNAHDELVSLIDEARDLCPRMSDDDPIAPALADWCRRARAALKDTE